jgi:hypothetical protein
MHHASLYRRPSPGRGGRLLHKVSRVKVPFDLLCSGSERHEQVVDDGEAMMSLVALYSTSQKKKTMAPPLIFAMCNTACNMHQFLFQIAVNLII